MNQMNELKLFPLLKMNTSNISWTKHGVNETWRLFNWSWINQIFIKLYVICLSNHIGLCLSWSAHLQLNELFGSLLQSVFDLSVNPSSDLKIKYCFNIEAFSKHMYNLYLHIYTIYLFYIKYCTIHFKKYCTLKSWVTNVFNSVEVHNYFIIVIFIIGLIYQNKKGTIIIIIF